MKVRTGFIGLGNLGTALVAGLLGHGGIEPSDTALANRSAGKAEALAARFPGVSVASGNETVIRECDLIFVCVRPDQLLDVLKGTGACMPGAHVVVTNGALSIDQLQSLTHAAVSKLVPSVTMEVGRGVSLLCHGPRVSKRQAERLEGMLGRASLVRAIPESEMEIAADLTSCGPALIAEMMGQFSRSGVRHGNLGQEEAWEMVVETMVGTALCLEGGMTVGGIRERVATKGGITEQGLKVIESELPQVMDHVMERTKAKHAEVRARTADRLRNAP